MDELGEAINNLSETIDNLPDIARLRASHNALLKAAREAVAHCDAFEYRLEASEYDALQAAIAAAEELTS